MAALAQALSILAATANLAQFDMRFADVPANGNTHMAYVAPDGRRAASFSICDKCGSTTMFEMLFLAVYGRRWVRRPTPPWVQEWTVWPKPGRPTGSMLLYAGHLQQHPEVAWVHYHVYRDPVDRYISSYFSKLRCCGDPKNRIACASDLGERKILRSLSWEAQVPIETPCVYFEEYAGLLNKARALNRSEGLDSHLRPQRFPSSAPHRIVLAGTVADTVPLLNRLTWLGLHKTADLGVTHATNKHGFKPTATAMRLLCSAAAPEYDSFKLPLNPLCNGTAN